MHGWTRLTVVAACALTVAGCGAPPPTPAQVDADTCPLARKALVLSVAPLAFDASSVVDVTGAEPGARVSFWWTTDPMPGCGCPAEAPGCLELREPELLGVAEADATGAAAITVTLPPDEPLGQRRIQAAQEGKLSAVALPLVSGEWASDLRLEDAEYAVHIDGGAVTTAVLDDHATLAVGRPDVGQVQLLVPTDAPRAALLPEIDALAELTITGAPGFGAFVAPAGDLDGDGAHDLFASDGRTVWSVSGGLADGPVALADVDRRSRTFPSVTGLVGQDLDGDGDADLAVSDADGVDLVLDPAWSLMPDVALAGLVAPRLAPAGDLDADGIADLAIGSGDTVQLWFGAGFLEVGPGVANARVGPGGDLDGDGYDDVLAADPGANEGRGQVFVVSGPIHPAVLVFEGSEVGEALGLGVSSGGDLDDDGVSELVATNAAGEVFLLWGPPGGLRSSFQADVFLVTGDPADGSAAPVAYGPGDVDGDGVSDLVVASGGPAAGAYVFRGAPGW